MRPSDVPRSATAVVIGRAGSRGLPGKNARMLAGRPMIAWTLDAIRDATGIGRVLLSTDCPTLVEQTRSVAPEAEIVIRPPALARDDTPVAPPVRHAVRSVNDAASMLVVLYANVPLRPAGLLDAALERLRRTGADSVQSYAPVGKHHPWWQVRIDEAGRVEPLHDTTACRRQDLPPCHLPDGGVIAVTRASLEAAESREQVDPNAFLGSDRRGIITRPGDVVDIDEPRDLLVAEAILAAGPAARRAG